MTQSKRQDRLLETLAQSEESIERMVDSLRQMRATLDKSRQLSALIAAFCAK